jgi:hypothetical protein
MIESIRYFSLAKRIENITKGVIFGCSQFRFDYPYRSKLSKQLKPIVAVTCYKWRPYTSIYKMGPEDRKRQEFLMNKLKIQCKEVPVVRARRFDNACYIPGLNEIKDQYTDSEWKELCQELCREWGMELTEFMNAVGPHMVILGDTFANAPTLAHEFGHYLNTIGKGESGGQRAHEKYGSAGDNATIAGLVSAMGSTAGYGAAISTLKSIPQAKSGNATLSAIGFAISSGSQITKIFVSRPIIKAETYASTTGLKNLKLAGATDSEMDIFRKDLIGALSTYKDYYQNAPIINAGLKAIGAATMGTLANHYNNKYKDTIIIR